MSCQKGFAQFIPSAALYLNARVSNRFCHQETPHSSPVWGIVCLMTFLYVWRWRWTVYLHWKQWWPFRETVRHNRDELKRRPVCGKQREVIAKTLTWKLSRSLFLEKLSQIDETVEDSRCRVEVPTMGVLKTISWDAGKKQHTVRLHDT